jgi:hypothetical protein
VTLFNISNQSIMVSPAVATARSGEQSGEAFSLAPQETRQMSLRSLMSELGVTEASEGFLTFRYTGPAHALDPALMLANPSNGFSLTPAFNARLQSASAGETNWQFPAVFLAGESQLGFSPSQNLTAYALISNGTNAPLAPQVNAFTTASGGGAAQGFPLPIAPLAPLETRLVNLSALAGSGALPGGVAHFALSVGHNGDPGTLAVTVFSLGQTGNFVFPSEGTVHPSNKMDSTYWDISGGLVALLTAYNPGASGVRATATLAYQTPDGVGSYTMPISLAANTSQVVNLREIITSGVPDSSGRVIPPGVTLGTLTLQTGGGGNDGGLVVGGCTTFDPVRGGYGDTLFPDCSTCDVECDFCLGDGSGPPECEPDCADPNCGCDSFTPATVAITGASFNPTSISKVVGSSTTLTVSVAVTSNGSSGAGTTQGPVQVQVSQLTNEGGVQLALSSANPQSLTASSSSGQPVAYTFTFAVDNLNQAMGTVKYQAQITDSGPFVLGTPASMTASVGVGVKAPTPTPTPPAE